MDQALIFWIILGMSVVTFLPRMLPLLFLSGKHLHPLIVSWLQLIPSAVLAAMLMPMLLMKDGREFSLGFDNLFLWVALICFPLAWKFKSLSLPVASGMGIVAFARLMGWA